MWYLLPPVALLIYYVVVLRRVRLPFRARAVVTRYNAPPGLSPAAVRYAWLGGAGVVSGGADARSLAALLADLLLRKQVSIYLRGAQFVLQRTPGAASTPLRDDEDLVLQRLLPALEPHPLAFDGRILVFNARRSLEESLWYELCNQFFVANLGPRALGIAAMLAWSFGVAWLRRAQWDANGILFGLAIVAIGGSIVTELFASRLGSKRAWLRPWAPWLVSVPVALFAFFALSDNTSREFALPTTLMLVTTLVFGARLRGPTAEGRKVLDDIAGYREFLQTVERPRLDRLAAADQPFTAALDEHLGYLIALDVRHHWGDQLTSAIAHVLQEEKRELEKE